MKTWMAKEETKNPHWWLIDATDKGLGRLSSQIAMILRGKHVPEFTPHIDGGDFVVVINCEKIKLTGQKEEKKVYHHHTSYIGGLKTRSWKEMKKKNPKFLVEEAVRGMLPKNRLGRKVFQKLKVYEGPEHPHSYQKPKAYNLAPTI